MNSKAYFHHRHYVCLYLYYFCLSFVCFVVCVGALDLTALTSTLPPDICQSNSLKVSPSLDLGWSPVVVGGLVSSSKMLEVLVVIVG